MPLPRLLLALGAGVLLTAAGCQLVTGVDTIDYSTNPGGGQGGQRSATTSTSHTQSANVSGTSTSSVPDAAASSTGVGPATCGNQICEAGESACNCKVDCGSVTQGGNGCCEPGEGPDCPPPMLCDHDGICEVNESCQHCSDCACEAPGMCPPGCSKDCASTTECNGMSSSSSGSPPLACCACPNGQSTCVYYGSFCSMVSNGLCSTLP